MNTLTTSDLNLLDSVLSIVSAIKCTGFSLSKEAVRAQAVDNSCILTAINKWTGPTLAAMDAPALKARLAAIRAQPNAIIEYECLPDGPISYISRLTMNSPKLKTTYRCARPASITAPAGVQDSPHSFLQLSPEDLSALTQSKSALQAERVNIVVTANKVQINLKDGSKDVFELQLPAATAIDGDVKQCNYSFIFSTLLLLLKLSANKVILFGQRSISVTVGEVDVVLLPKKDD